MTLTDLTFIAAPRISVDEFNRVLVRAASPAAPYAEQLYRIPQGQGLDPAIPLAFFQHESSFGTAGIARQTLNWGNLRRSMGRARKVMNGWAWYVDWRDSLADWCDLIVQHYVRQGRPTVIPALRVYAPSSDHNNPDAYAAQVLRSVLLWQGEDKNLITHGAVRPYRVRQNCTAGAVLRAAPSQSAAAKKVLEAGQLFTGSETQGGLVTLASFGSSRTWIEGKDADGVAGFIWNNLLEKGIA